MPHDAATGALLVPIAFIAAITSGAVLIAVATGVILGIIALALL
jgi:hypothetical protein